MHIPGLGRVDLSNIAAIVGLLLTVIGLVLGTAVLPSGSSQNASSAGTTTATTTATATATATVTATATTTNTVSAEASTSREASESPSSSAEPTPTSSTSAAPSPGAEPTPSWPLSPRVDDFRNNEEMLVRMFQRMFGTGEGAKATNNEELAAQAAEAVDQNYGLFFKPGGTPEIGFAQAFFEDRAQVELTFQIPAEHIEKSSVSLKLSGSYLQPRLKGDKLPNTYGFAARKIGDHYYVVVVGEHREK